MAPGDGGTLLVASTLVLFITLFTSVGAAANKCGPCECSTLKPEDGDTAAGLLVNCSGVAPPLGALPHPALTQDAQIQEALQRAAFVRLELSRCDANRLQPLPALGAPLRALDLSHNGLTELEGNALRQHKDSLREINLDFNSLEDLDGNALLELKELTELRVEHNALKELRLGALPSGLLKLRAAGNSLSQLTAAPSSAHAMQLQDLDLFNNKFEELSEETLRALWSLVELRALRLAGNPLRVLDGNALLRLPQLRHLDVSRCGLKALGFSRDTQQLPKLEVLSAGHNALSASEVASIAEVLPTLQELHLSHNEIEVFPALAPLTALKVLNLSENSILTLPPVLPKLQSLVELDMSRNKLQSVPPGALGTSSLPALRALWLDGNEPLASLQLEAPLPQLRFLSASGLTRLRALGASAFKGLRSTASRVRGNSSSCDVTADGSLPGLSLRLSGNEQLTDVDAHAFEGLPLCELDLSGCALASVSEQLAPWKALRAVDLQRNPWACECALQWMVDSVVVPMYDKGNSQLLYELRCETPSELRGRRLVHFYAWPKALCSPREKLQRMLSPEAARSNTLSAGRGMLIALCTVGVIFVATVVAGLTMHYQALKRRRRQNRRV